MLAILELRTSIEQVAGGGMPLQDLNRQYLDAKDRKRKADEEAQYRRELVEAEVARITQIEEKARQNEKASRDRARRRRAIAQARFLALEAERIKQEEYHILLADIAKLESEINLQYRVERERRESLANKAAEVAKRKNIIRIIIFSLSEV